MTPFWVAVAEWALPVCDVAEMASGVPGVAVVPSAVSVLTSLVPVDVAVLSSTVSAATFVLASSSALSVSLLAAPACDCCSATA